MSSVGSAASATSGGTGAAGASAAAVAAAQRRPLDYKEIQNTIARYCVALDTKDFDLLKDVFTADVSGNYPFNNGLNGVAAVSKAIQKRLEHITSQHALTTQIIEVAENGRSAHATTYFTGIHFGKGKWSGKQVTAWGSYKDTLIQVGGKPGVPGASGRWRISRRVVMFMGRLGEEKVMEGEA